MGEIIFIALILLFIGEIQCDVMCHQCMGIGGNCNDNPPPMSRCKQGTQMCYVIAKTKGKYYERGCLSPASNQWYECIITRHNYCFSCYGSGCNNMPFYTKPSRHYCIVCKNAEECKTVVFAERCNASDSLLGPPACFVKYDKSNNPQIIQKGCVNDEESFGASPPGLQSNVMTCTGDACNFVSPEQFQRCISYVGSDKYFNDKKKVVNCYVGHYVNLISGCFIDRKIDRFGIIVKFGCQSHRFLNEIKQCASKPRECNLCEGDLCNNVANPLLLNYCQEPDNKIDYCDHTDSMCYIARTSIGLLRSGCYRDGNVTGIYLADTLMCSNKKIGEFACSTLAGPLEDYRGCYECSHPPCDDVLFTLGYKARTICPLGTTQCYSSRSAQGVTYRGCYTGNSEGVKVCKDSIGACRICSGNNCNIEKVVTLRGQCYKSNWKRPDRHETTLRFADCTGYTFEGNREYCYIAASSRLFMRMGCVSELVSGIDDSYALTFGSTSVAWLYQNTCYKCVSNVEGFCLDVYYLKQHTCLGLNRYPVRGCYTLIDKRNHKVERGCITELNEYMLRLCDMSVFHEKCRICQDNGCNNENYENF